MANRKLDNEIDRLESVFGGNGGRVDIVPVLVPMSTYQLLLEKGKQLGITPAEVLTRSIELFLQPKQDIKIEEKKPEPIRRDADFIIRRPK